MRMFEQFFGQKVPVMRLKRMQRHYQELLLRKEQEIEDLKADKQLLLRHGLSQAAKRRELWEHSKKVIDINRQLNEQVKRKVKITKKRKK